MPRSSLHSRMIKANKTTIMSLKRRSSFHPLIVCLVLLLLSLGVLATVVEAAVAVQASNDDDGTLDVENSNDPQEPEEPNNDAGTNTAQSFGGGGGGSSQSSSSRSSSPTLANNPTLDSNSVVLITGAAGFIGSELALALRRTFRVRKLLLVDNLGIDSENEAAYVAPPSKKDDATHNGGNSKKAVYETLGEEELSMFEIKRQRAFRIFHELTSFVPSSLEGGGVMVDNNNNEGNGGAGSIRFYRADMRPSIPEFFDFGEVPLLEGIFQSHPDITHVVHLADVPVSAQNQAIPRNKDSVKTGRMEGLLEEMRLMIERANNSDGNENSVRLPQFVYASSHEVYDRIGTPQHAEQRPNPPPFQEDKPITTPSSLHGTAKLIDEVLASAYHSTHGIYSVGMRFFNVYGPWNSPGTEVFDLAERVSTMNDNGSGSLDDVFTDHKGLWDKDVNDYVYIDDAVDAILGAMQYRPPGSDPPPVVFNVGSGEGHTLGELRDDMAKHFPKLGSQISAAQQSSAKANNPTLAERQPTKSIASTSRSESLLGFKAQVSLEEGLAHTLTWHRDRTFPYGSDPYIEESFERRGMNVKIAESLAKSRRASVAGGLELEEDDDECSPLDRECLRGAPVFPCASECRRSEQCTPSAWDDVVTLSKLVTTGCDAVLYTILLDEHAEQIPSATAAVNTDSLPYVGAGLPEDVGKRTQARCNIAFVSYNSPLVRRLKSEGEEYLDEEGTDNNIPIPPLLRHGFWTVLPVSTPSSLDSKSQSWLHAFDGTFALEFLPKMSPGQFFGSSVRYAVYAAPSVLVENLPELLRKMEDGPQTASPPSSSSGSTALMLASKRPGCDRAQQGSSCANKNWKHPHQNDMIQSHVYNMIRVALRGDILGGGLEPTLDSSLVVHSLRGEDSRLFRCDVYGEASQWGASGDERALEFIISLHDLWSRAVVHWSSGGTKPWWIDVGGDGTGANLDGTEKKQEAKEDVAQLQQRRRLQEEAGTWMGVLSSSEVQLFTHIIPSDGMGIVHLE